MTRQRLDGRTKRASAVRGFTLVELTIVVTIIGILATIGIYSVYKYIQQAKASEAAEIVAAIKAGQEAYYDETFQYLKIPATNDPNTFYPGPITVSGKIKIQWGAVSPDGCTDCGPRYAALGVLPAAPVLFRYSCYVGAATDNPNTGFPSGIGGTSPYAGTTAGGQPFYVVNAVSDLDGSGAPMSYVTGSNLMGDLNSQNIGQ